MAQGSGMSGLSEDEAKGFPMECSSRSFIGFVVIAALAHVAAFGSGVHGFQA